MVCVAAACRGSAKIAREQETRVQPRVRRRGEVAASVARDWQQVSVKERLGWLYEYDATAVQI
jgi:hypothetical protein